MFVRPDPDVVTAVTVAGTDCPANVAPLTHGIGTTLITTLSDSPPNHSTPSCTIAHWMLQLPGVDGAVT